MKKVFSVLRSMRFANLLLALVALLCGLSSLLPQGRELPFYAENYPQTYTLISMMCSGSGIFSCCWGFCA